MDTQRLNKDQIEKAAALLRAGGVVAFPTETVYGLGAVIWDEQAIKKIYLAKGRPEDNPLIAHVATLEQARECARELPNSFYELANAFWPGPLSIVVKKSFKVPLVASAGLESIAIRMPSDKIALELIAKVGAPLVAPSANRSGFPSATCSEHVLDDFDGIINGVVLGEPSQVGIESTVISLLDPLSPVILRSGTISAEQLSEVLKRPVLLAPKSSEKPLSPGMKYKHYSPLTPIYLFDEHASFQEACLLNTQKCAVFCDREEFEKGSSHFSGLKFLGELNATNLYQALRELDKTDFACALILSSKAEVIWPRLFHATAGQINVKPAPVFA